MVVLDVITQAAKEGGAIGEDSDDNKFAYKDEKTFKAALRKFVLDTPTRVKRKIDRIKAGKLKRVSEVPKDLMKYADAVYERQQSRRAKRKKKRGASADSEDEEVSIFRRQYLNIN